ncbi:MAG: hypothetical protein NTY01_09950 [Verrucomicrobia bacterium]|nr:hypothetical protein [Verrucomicrobiota bacterium]
MPVKLEVHGDIGCAYTIKLFLSDASETGYLLECEMCMGPYSIIPERYFDREKGKLFWRREFPVLTAKKLFKTLETIALPLTPSYEIGEDGVAYELEIGEGDNRVCLRWWNELPPEWNGLAPVVKALERLSEAGDVLGEMRRLNREKNGSS